MKLNQIYDKEAFTKFADSCNKGLKFKDGVLLARSLTKIDPTLIEKAYPENVFMNAGFDISNVGGYANFIQTLRVLDQGGFKTATGSSGDQGLISLAGEDSTLAVFERAAQAVWNDTEVQQAAMEGFNIAGRYVQAVDRIYKQDLDTAGLVGLKSGQYGILNTTAFTAVPFGATIDAGTAKAAYEAVTAFILQQRNAVFNTPEYMANKLFMPVTTFNWLQKTIFEATAGNGSVLKALQENYPEIMFLPTPRAESVGATKVMSLVSTNPNAMKFRLPVPLKNAPLETNGFRKSTDYVYRIGGMDVLESTCGLIATGV
jgi:hypothetical protein